ncbi:MAG: phage integrase family protein [Rhodoferax sp.]
MTPRTSRTRRKLNRGHFAFMRALVQGVDERISWDRYLRLEGEHTDLRIVRKTIDWIRDEFAAAAKREHRPGTAKLILLDPDRFGQPDGAELPSLEAFAAERGMEDFSEADQAEAYAEAYPQAVSGGDGIGGARERSRRARLIERQMEALRWLEALVAQDPRPGDGVGAWLNPSLADRLEKAGLPTLFTLVERINGIGARWYLHVPGVGQGKAGRIVDWLRDHEDSIGLRIGSHVGRARQQLSPATLANVVPSATSLVPLEKFLVPAHLDGRAGRYRAPPEQCLLMASNDYEAIQAWLAAKRSAASEGSLSPTQRAYRKEAERLLLWAILEQKKPLSSLSVEDASAYRSFLADPPAHWCGPRYHQRWSPLWRPLEGPLSPMAQRQALIILKSLYTFLVSQNYLLGNPFAGVAMPRNPQRPLGSSRTLTFAQWDHLSSELGAQGLTEPGRRLARAVRWLYATGLRLAEITHAKCEDLERIEYRTAEGEPAAGWLLSVIGKGGRSRQVPVPLELVNELEGELEQHGFERNVSAETNQRTPILARFDPEQESPLSWSASGLYQAIKAFFEKAASQLEGFDAQQLCKASTHWLRHSHGSHALQGREGRAPVPIQVVQNNLGHASIGTTSGYLTTEREDRLRAMQGFWGGG